MSKSPQFTNTEVITILSTDDRSVLSHGQHRYRVDKLNSLTGEREDVCGWFTAAHLAKEYILKVCTDRLNWKLEYRVEREYWQQAKANHL